MKTAFTLALAISILGASAHAASYTALKPGLWQIDTAMRMQGMPAEMAPIPFTSNQCVTQEQLDNQESLMTVSSAKFNCKVSDAVVSDTQTTWKMNCDSNGLPMTGTGKIMPQGKEKITGTVDFMMSQVAGTATVNGKWLGTCDGFARQPNRPEFKPEAAPVAPVVETPVPPAAPSTVQ